MRELLKNIYYSDLGYKIFSPLRKIYFKLKIYFPSEFFFVVNKFKKRHGYKLNLDNPKTFNEKIAWLKLNYRKPIMSSLADKYEVRSFVDRKIGKEYLIPLINVFHKMDEINFNKLPRSFVLKAAHGSSWNIVSPNKQKLDIRLSKMKLNDWFNTNYYALSREWVYKGIQPKFVCEEFIKDKNGLSPKDYKIFCFDGKPKYIQIDLDRFSGHSRVFYDLNWQKLPFGLEYPTSEIGINKPDGFNEMIRIAKVLSQGFPFSRIDLFNLEGKIYFGEITFFPDDGSGVFEPAEWDLILGKDIILDKI